jgi:hypothetical protein
LSYEPDSKGTSADGSVGVSSNVNLSGSQPKQ